MKPINSIFLIDAKGRVTTSMISK